MLSETVDNHDAVFYRLHEHNSGLKPPSASFLTTTYVSYLVCVVSEEGINKGPVKIRDTFKNWPIPKSVKKVRKFLVFTEQYMFRNWILCHCKITE